MATTSPDPAAAPRRALPLHRRLSLKWKLISLILVIKVLTLVLLGAGLYLSQRRLMKQSLLRNLSILAEVISRHSAAALAFQDAPAAAETLKSLSESPHIRLAGVYAPGRLFARYERPGSAHRLPDRPPSEDLLDFAGDRVALVRPIALDHKTLGVLYVESDAGDLTALMKDYLVFSLWLFAGIFVLTLLLAMRMQRWITAPIIELAGTTQAVAARQDYSLRAQKHTEDELGTLVDGMNAMLTEIQRRDQALQDAHALLEQRVAERTEALTRTTRQLERANKDLEKANLELDSFVYTASHDLRAPLRAISSFAAFLEEDHGPALNDQAREYLKEIRLGTERMNRLITDLLALSRITRIHNPYESVDMNALVRTIVERLAFELKETGADVRLSARLPTVVGDRIKLTEVILNLIHNAIKFTSKRPLGPPWIEFGYLDREHEHVFFVKDNGIGIDPRYHQQIFGLFSRLHTQEEYEGTGAGLNIVKRVVEDHGGAVWVESALGQGACYFFSLPKTVTAPEPPDGSSPRDPPAPAPGGLAADPSSMHHTRRTS